MAKNIVEMIADEVGVSPITVTRALNHDVTYRRPTFAKRAERIRALAAEHGYRMNTAAKAMSTGKFHAVGLLHSTIPYRSHTSSSMLDGVYKQLRENNLHLVSSSMTDAELTDEARMPKLLRELSVDGLLLDYLTDVPTGLRRLVARHAIPTIWLNIKQDHDAVYPDDVAAGRLATEHLLRHGHQRVVYMCLGRTSHYSGLDRLAGYRDAMRDAGLDPVSFWPGDVPFGERGRVATKWLAGHAGEVDAVVCYGAGTSTALMVAGLQRGMKIGKDLALVTMAGELDVSVGFPVTTVLLPFEAMGRVGCAELIEKIANPEQERVSRTVQPGFERGVTS